MSIQNRNYFFTSTVNSERFLSQDEPTEQVMRNFADSIAFKVEVSDTSTETQQGLTETATQAEFDNGIDNSANGFALYVRPSMIKNAINALFSILQPQIDQNSANITTIQGDIATIQGDITNIQNQFGEDMPLGSIIMYPKTTPPNTKWMLCEGQTLDNTLYPDLFSLIGYNFGGSGVHFSLPDMRSKFIAGFDATAPAEYQTIGQGGGANSVTLTGNQTGTNAHSHTATTSLNITSDGLHSHDAIELTTSGTANAVLDFKNVTSSPGTGGTDSMETIQPNGAHSHGGSTASTVVNAAVSAPALEAHENRPEFIVFPYMIKVTNQ